MLMTSDPTAQRIFFYSQNKASFRLGFSRSKHLFKANFFSETAMDIAQYAWAVTFKKSFFCRINYDLIIHTGMKCICYVEKRL